MPADDREQKFERALAQHLRAGAGHTGCPDAETLAAYHERTLSLEEMAQWKQHIASCAACQEALALVEVTEKELAEEWKEHAIPVVEAAARPAPAKASALRAIVSEKVAAAAGPLAVLEKKRRPMLLRWAVPVGAIAAGVLVWIGIHEQHAPESAKQAGTEVAMNRREVAPEATMTQPAARPAEPFAERDDKRAQLDEETARKELERAKNESRGAKLAAPRILNDELKKDSQSRDAGRGGGKAGSERGAFSDKAVSPIVVQNAPATPEKTQPSVSESLEASGAAPVPQPPSPASPKPSAPGAAGNVVGGVAGQRSADEDAKKAEVAKRKSEQQLETSDAATGAMMMKQGVHRQTMSALTPGVIQPGVILSPDNKVWWKIGAGATVELTTDAGKTWKTTDTGAGNELTAGSAPSSKICWIAGKGGALVLTTDHGKHWKKIATPIAGDLGGVHAADAKHASIWDAANRASYETSDGGATWKQIANE